MHVYFIICGLLALLIPFTDIFVYVYLIYFYIKDGIAYDSCCILFAYIILLLFMIISISLRWLYAC